PLPPRRHRERWRAIRGRRHRQGSAKAWRVQNAVVGRCATCCPERGQKQLTDEQRQDAISPETLETSRPAPEPGGMGLKDDFIMALRCFSRRPTGSSPHQKPELWRIAMALPLASVAIGIGPALVLIGFTLIGLPTLFAAALAVGAMVLASGAMAEDALADAAD